MMIDIKGYEGRYAITDDGRVWSYPKKRNSGGSEGKFMCPNIDKDGYHLILLCNSGVERRFKIHRLVCQAFLPNPENKPQVNHKNGIKNDNRLENLSWCTKSENEKHKYSVLMYPKPRNEKGMKLFKERFIEGRKRKTMQLTKEGILCKVYESVSEAKRIYGNSIDHSLSGKIKYAYGYNWKYLI